MKTKYTGLFYYSTNGEEYEGVGATTIEEVLQEALADMDFEVGDMLHVGPADEVDLTVNAKHVIDNMQEHVWESNGEWAENFLKGTTFEQEKLLQEMLTETFGKWIAQTGLGPIFFTINEYKLYIYKGNQEWIEKKKTSDIKW